MEIKFIGQGLDAESHTTGDLIIESLSDNEYSFFNAFVAFVSTGGLKNIVDQLTNFIDRGGNIRLFVGVDLNATSKEALETLLELGIETYVIYSPNNIIFHPKIYIFEGVNKMRAIVGSNNLTESGLFQNIEASVCVDFPNNDEDGNIFLAEIYDQFNSLVSTEHPSCQLLNQEVLNILMDSKVVLSEIAVRAKHNQVRKQFEQKEASILATLNQTFGKIKPKRPPKGYRKSVTKKDLVSDAIAELNIVELSTELLEGAMWIETGKMTGGSRNILDLSKHGKLGDADKFGSVSFFGIDPESIDDSVDITLVFGGKTYPNNRIFYAPANNNWRLRINGEAEDGERITTFSIPSLGYSGGFQDVILLFTKIEEDSYRLEVLDKEEMPKLIDNSADWARGGHGTGRAYGVIN